MFQGGLPWSSPQATVARAGRAKLGQGPVLWGGFLVAGGGSMQEEKPVQGVLSESR